MTSDKSASIANFSTTTSPESSQFTGTNGDWREESRRPNFN
jgi:hypothetical protein